MIFTPQNLSDPHKRIVYCVAKEKGCRSVGSPNDEVADVVRQEFLLPPDPVLETEHMLLGYPKPQGRLQALSPFKANVVTIQMRAFATVTRRFTGCQLDFSGNLKLGGRAKTGVGQTLGFELVVVGFVNRSALGLKPGRNRLTAGWAFRPIEAQPAQIIQKTIDEFGSATFSIGVLYPQQKLRTTQSAEQGCSGITNVDQSGGAGSKTSLGDLH
jgi:hypothetical protein